MKHPLSRCVLAFLLSVLLGVAFLLAGACLPQTPIDENLYDSMEVINQNGNYPLVADRSFGSTLDMTTDVLILLESKFTSIDCWETIFTNPLYYNWENPDPTAPALLNLSLESFGQPSKYYVQYWMGFRPIIRLLLCFLDYFQILRYTAVVFFALLAAVMCSIAQRLGSKTAFLFALSIILVRPHVIAVSLQFTCCFFIAFTAMLLTPLVRRHPGWESLFFLELGIATQFFDFYTVPVLTFCLPMTYLYLLQAREGERVAPKALGANALSWSAGYGFMWLAKLAMTSLLTEADGLAAGFSSFFQRIGVEKTAELEAYYSPITALRTVAASLYSDREGLMILIALAAVAGLWLLARFLKKRPALKLLLRHWPLLLLAALPLIWFMAAAQPTANHHWFQYRSIAASCFAGLAYLQLILQPESSQ